MKIGRLIRGLMLCCSGAMLLQESGCTLQTLEVIQTGLLAITAAGAVAILQNI